MNDELMAGPPVTGLVAGALAGTGRLDVTRRVETIVPELNATSFALPGAPLDLTRGLNPGGDRAERVA